MSFSSSSNPKELLRIDEEQDLISYKVTPGSRLRIPQGAFDHWAIYIGDGDICHLTTRNLSGSMPSSGNPLNGKIEVKSFTDMMSGCGDNIPKVYVDNSDDSRWTPLPQDEIVRRAKSKKGDTNYSLTSRNCEQFVNWCRYGKEVSHQVDNAASAGGALLAGAAASYFGSR